MSKTDQKMRERYEARSDTKPSKMRGYGRDREKERPPRRTGKYEVVYVRRDGSMSTVMRDLAPQTAVMLAGARNRKAAFVIRYWPSRKAWRLLDARQAVGVMRSGKFNKFEEWSGHKYHDTLCPTKEAAEMLAITLAAGTA